MKRKPLMRALSLALLFVCLIGVLPLLACSSGNSHSQETVPEESTYAVQINVDCEQNLLFSRYDVNVNVDSEEIGNIEHGGEATFEVKLTKGQHELKFEDKNSTSPSGKTPFVVEGEGDKFAYRIKCTKSRIEIESIKEKPTNQGTDSQVVSYDGISIKVPSRWTVTDADEGKYVYPEYGGMVYVYASDLELTQSSADEAYAEIMGGFLESGQYTVTDKVEKSNVGKAVAFKNAITLQTDDLHFTGKMELILAEDKMYAVMFVIPDSNYDQHSDAISVILDSIKLDKPTAPVFANDSEKERPKKDETAADDANAPSKNAKSGVFEYCYVRHPYKKTDTSYDVYFLIDEDTHVVVDFQSDGPEDIWVSPYRGNLNDGIELDLIDAGEVIAHWYARWDSKDSPETLILVDDDGFETKFEACAESEALSFFSEAMWEKIGL